MNEYFDANRKCWDQTVKPHFESEFYDMAGFREGKSSVPDVEIEEVGNVEGKSLLHLQCHFGQDTLSWARMGAEVTGVDFSSVGIEQANDLAQELNLEAEFICCNIYDLADHLKKQFDIVYTSSGVLLWLGDLEKWAQIISDYLKPGGIFYIREFHPVFFMLDNDSKTTSLSYPYFKLDSPTKEEGSYPDYADPDVKIQGITYEWSHSLGEIVSALIDAGLQIEFLHEFNTCNWNLHPSLVQGEDGLWRYPDLEGGLPLMFSIRAKKH